MGMWFSVQWRYVRRRHTKPVQIGANAVQAAIDAINGVDRTEKVIEAETTVVDISLVENYLK